MIGKRFSMLGENGSFHFAMLGSFLTAGLAPTERSARASDQADAQTHGPSFLAKLPLVWLERACFRARLRADLKEDPLLLRDIGINLHEASAESMRFFWEPIVLTRS
ncbi:MAG: hypothetical protein JOY90_08640 [Bradyrhizobium sp.]|uniref:hypothetical protein n=1 Tax=Bradyrhizobium sp. TaxID=376 RepID=UPI001DBABA2E|nr:hypothetical protein [Bradyrhizobium sp.]MBV9560514.1 hypothetical protein [Bradyrhizobium sp.]